MAVEYFLMVILAVAAIVYFANYCKHKYIVSYKSRDQDQIVESVTYECIKCGKLKRIKV